MRESSNERAMSVYVVYGAVYCVKGTCQTKRSAMAINIMKRRVKVLSCCLATPVLMLSKAHLLATGRCSASHGNRCCSTCSFGKSSKFAVASIELYYELIVQAGKIPIDHSPVALASACILEVGNTPKALSETCSASRANSGVPYSIASEGSALRVALH